jgi:hypothetical protein
MQNYTANRAAINKDVSLSFFQKEKKLAALDGQYAADLTDEWIMKVKVGNNVATVIKPWFSDLVNTHVCPSPDNQVYQNPGMLSTYVAQKQILPLLGGTDAWSWPTMNFVPNTLQAPPKSPVCPDTDTKTGTGTGST